MCDPLFEEPAEEQLHVRYVYRKKITPKKKDKMHSEVGGEEIAASPLVLQHCGGMFLH